MGAVLGSVRNLAASLHTLEARSTSLPPRVGTIKQHLQTSLSPPWVTQSTQ